MEGVGVFVVEAGPGEGEAVAVVLRECRARFLGGILGLRDDIGW